MKLNEIKPIIEKYMNKAFRLYQDDFELEVVFTKHCSIEFKWDDNKNVTSVIIKTSQGDYEGNTEDHFIYAIELLKVNSEIILLS